MRRLPALHRTRETAPRAGEFGALGLRQMLRISFDGRNYERRSKMAVTLLATVVAFVTAGQLLQAREK